MAAGSGTNGADERPDERAAEPLGGAPSIEATHGGAWLTYRYRLEGPDTPTATGTIKAPSFGTAARRALGRGLDASLGAAPAHLRLRAAGEREVVFRVSRTETGAAKELRLDVVPAGSHANPSPADPPGATEDDEPPASAPPRLGSEPASEV